MFGSSKVYCSENCEKAWKNTDTAMFGLIQAGQINDYGLQFLN